MGSLCRQSLRNLRPSGAVRLGVSEEVMEKWPPTGSGKSLRGGGIRGEGQVK